MQKISIAKLTSIYLTDRSSPEVRRIEPNVINRKSEKFFLYITNKFFWNGINGTISKVATKYLKIIASPTPTPKL